MPCPDTGDALADLPVLVEKDVQVHALHHLVHPLLAAGVGQNDREGHRGEDQRPVAAVRDLVHVGDQEGEIDHRHQDGGVALSRSPRSRKIQVIMIPVMVMVPVTARP